MKANIWSQPLKLHISKSQWPVMVGCYNAVFIQSLKWLGPNRSQDVGAFLAKESNDCSNEQHNTKQASVSIMASEVENKTTSPKWVKYCGYAINKKVNISDVYISIKITRLSITYSCHPVLTLALWVKTLALWVKFSADDISKYFSCFPRK